jgi:hypothetical protein
MSDANGTVEADYYSGSDFVLSISARFWLYLIPNVLSIGCSFFVLYHLLFDRTLRQALNNHVFMVLLVIGLVFELIDIPLTLHYYRFGTTWRLTSRLSLFWTYIDFAFYTAQVIIFAWATIERHILVFHYHWVATTKKRFFIHYLPVIILLSYIFIYCFIIIYFPSCENMYYHSYINGVPVPCLIDKTIIAKYDLVCHQIIPTFTIVIFSVVLFIRVLYQKSRFNGENNEKWQFNYYRIQFSIFSSIFHGHLLIYVTKLVYQPIMSLNFDLTRISSPVTLYFYFHLFTVDHCLSFGRR